jgi:hypothetical protein
VALAQLLGLEIDFGLRVRKDSSDSEIWPQFVSIEVAQPRITLRGNRSKWFGAAGVPLAGLNGTHANTSLYLRKRAAGGTFVANATAEHIKFTAAGLAYVDKPGSFSGNNPGETSITLVTKYDGTNYPITVNTAIAHPA